MNPSNGNQINSYIDRDQNGSITSIIEEVKGELNNNCQLVVCSSNGESQYCTEYRPKSNPLASFVPMEDDLLKYGAILLPSGVEEYLDEKTLFQDLIAYLHRYFDTTSDNEILLALYALTTWLYDVCPCIPIINFRGAKQTGKTRGANTLLNLCYHGMRSSGASSYASLFRSAHRWNGTLFINESDMDRSNESNMVVKYLNERYQKDGMLWRMNGELTGTDAFIAYGPTILTTRQSFLDDALESRCLTIPCARMKRTNIPYNTDSEYQEKAEHLRNQLLLFRFKHYNSFLIDQSTISGISPRLNQITQPMMSIAMLIDNEVAIKFLGIVKRIENAQVEGAMNSVDSLIVRAFFALEKEGLSISSTALSEKIFSLGSEVSSNRIGRRMGPLGFAQIKNSLGREFKLKNADDRENLIKSYLPKEEQEELMTQLTEKTPF